jgi:polyribonucleotide nucleotidyltransferase
MDFGAFVNFLGSRDGLVHISELAPQRVKQVGDVVQVGQQVKVKVIGMDDRGKVKLSMKVVDQATGADISDQVAKEDAERRSQRNAERASE